MPTSSPPPPRSRLHQLLHSLLRIIAFALLAFFGVSLILLAAVMGHAGSDTRQPSDVIVVLGAGLSPDNTPNLALRRRTEQGAILWRAGLAPIVVCSGGYGLNRTRSEADACRELLQTSGVPLAAIRVEDRSRSTEENAFYTQELMAANGWRSALIVSDGYHLLRAEWIFASEDLIVSHSPAPPPGVLGFLRSSLREVAALHWLAFKTLLGLPFTYVPIL